MADGLTSADMVGDSLDPQTSARFRESAYPPVKNQLNTAVLAASALPTATGMGDIWRRGPKHFVCGVSLSVFNNHAKVVYDYLLSEATRALYPRGEPKIGLDGFLTMVRAAVQIRLSSVLAPDSAETKPDWYLEPNTDFVLPRSITILLNRIGITTLMRNTMRVFPAVRETDPYTSRDVFETHLPDFMAWMDSLVDAKICVVGSISTEPTGGAWWLCQTADPSVLPRKPAVPPASSCVVGALFDDIPSDDIIYAAYIRQGFYPVIAEGSNISGLTEDQVLKHWTTYKALVSKPGATFPEDPTVEPAPNDKNEVAGTKVTEKSRTDYLSTNFRPERRMNIMFWSNLQNQLIVRVMNFIRAN